MTEAQVITSLIGMTNTDDLTLIELQRAWMDDLDNLDKKDAYL